MSSRDQDRELLRREIVGHGDLLRRLNEALGSGGYATWTELVEFMHGTDGDPARKDAVLRVVLQSLAQDHDPRWRSTLLLFFWHGLESILWQKQKWDSCIRERWDNIVWAFLQAVSKLDVTRRPERIATKLINDTVHLLYAGYDSEWSRAELEPTIAPQEARKVAGAADSRELRSVDDRDEAQVRLNGIRDLVESGVIDESDFLLIVRTRIYGQSIKEYCLAHGLDYQTQKKRRQRAEAEIRRRRKIDKF